MTTILNGLLGGFLIGLIAATVIRFMIKDSSATATLLEKWVELFILTSYGGFAGGTLIALELFVLEILAVPPTTIEAFGVAVAWSVFLFGMLNVVWRVAPSRWFPDSYRRKLLVYHLVYGLGLSLWIRLTWIT